MVDKKLLIQQYKERKRVGGICAIHNVLNDKRLIFKETDLEAGRNRFDFMVKTNSCFNLKLQRDWSKQGASAFEFEVLEVLEKKDDETLEDFQESLKVMEALIKEKYEKDALYV